MMSFEAAAPDYDVNITQPDHERDRPRHIAWDYERLGFEPLDIDEFLSEQFNTAQARIRDPRSFREYTARLSRHAKDQADFLRRLAERQTEELTAFEARYEDFSYRVLSASLPDEGSRHALIDLSRNRSMINLLHVLESFIHSENDHAHENEPPRASGYAIVASKVQTQCPHTPSERIPFPVSNSCCDSMESKSAKFNVIPEGSKKRKRPVDEVNDGGHGPVKRRRIMSRNYMRPTKRYAPDDKPSTQKAHSNERNGTDSLLRRTSLSSVSSATSDTNSTSTGCFDHESCCCGDETPVRDEKNDKMCATATAEQTHGYEHVSGGISMRLSGLKVVIINELACFDIIDDLNKDGGHICANDSQ